MAKERKLRPVSFRPTAAIADKLQLLADMSHRTRSDVLLELVRSACYRGPDLEVCEGDSKK